MYLFPKPFCQTGNPSIQSLFFLPPPPRGGNWSLRKDHLSEDIQGPKGLCLLPENSPPRGGGLGTTHFPESLPGIGRPFGVAQGWGAAQGLSALSRCTRRGGREVELFQHPKQGREDLTQGIQAYEPLEESGNVILGAVLDSRKLGRRRFGLLAVT